MAPPHRPGRRRRSARLVLLAASLVVVVPGMPPAVSAPGPVDPVEPIEPVVVIEGRGHGHGVGMAQDGALAMGAAGSSTAEVLQHFYPGTTIGEAGGEVRVAVLSGAGEAMVSFPGGGEVRSPRDGPQEPGFPVSVGPGGTVRLFFDGSYRAEPMSGGAVAASTVSEPVVMGSAPSQHQDGDGGELLRPGLLGGSEPPPDEAPPPDQGPPPAPPAQGSPPPREAPPQGPPPGPPAPAGPPPGGPPPAEPGPPPPQVATSGSAMWAVPTPGATVAVPARSARYRGVVQAVAGDGGLRLVNQLGVEDYLRGMGEVRDSGWPAAALGAQAVAARTYALRAMTISGELCDSQDCQVYLGQQAEYAAMDAAVAATRGQVVRFDGALAQAVYSASGGGVSATPEEGFATSSAGLPYLRAAPYPTGDPQPWAVRMSLDHLSRRLAYPGNLHDVRVAQAGPSGRPLIVELLGDAGRREVGGLAVRDALVLRSTLWGVRVEHPPAPPADDPAQARAWGRFGAIPLSAGVTGGKGRPLGSLDSSATLTLSDLEGPLRAATTAAAAALVVAAWVGWAFHLTARGSRRRTGRPR